MHVPVRLTAHCSFALSFSYLDQLYIANETIWKNHNIPTFLYISFLFLGIQYEISNMPPLVDVQYYTVVYSIKDFNINEL